MPERSRDDLLKDLENASDIWLLDKIRLEAVRSGYLTIAKRARKKMDEREK